MPISIYRGNTLAAIRRLSVFARGQLREARSVKMMTGGELKVVFSAAASGGGGGGFTAVASPEAVYGYDSTSGRPKSVTSTATTAMVTGGTSPFSYAWQIVAGDVAITAPTSATTAFRAAVLGERLATARCTVTDALGATADCDVQIYLFVENVGSG